MSPEFTGRRAGAGLFAADEQGVGSARLEKVARSEVSNASKTTRSSNVAATRFAQRSAARSHRVRYCVPRTRRLRPHASPNEARPEAIELGIVSPELGS